MAYGYNLEAEYESGYIHQEGEHDHSPYVRGKNIFNDILDHRPEKVHGKMLRFSLIGQQHRYDIDWKTLPNNARPIYFRRMELDFSPEIGAGEQRCISHNFGYQYTDEAGHNQQEVKEII